MEIHKSLDNWDTLKQFFPPSWEEQAKNLGALTRQRKINSANVLLRTLLIHFSDGCSMRETVARASAGNLVNISDVALLKRLKASSEWLRWMSNQLLIKKGLPTQKPHWLSKYNIKSVDASVITEPGSTGTDWRLHYCMNLFGLNCEEFIITRQDVGESFVNFSVQKDDLFIGDRAYGSLKGFNHIQAHGGDFVTRIRKNAFNLYDHNNEQVNLLGILRKLSIGEIGDFELQTSRETRIRICAIKKTEEAAEASKKKTIKEYKKKQRKLCSETLEFCEYIIVATSLNREITARQILDLYRTRWQIEIAFKRLKSIMGLGHLPKKDEESCRAWLHGKIFVALLTQSIVDEGRNFSPWGYPI